MASIGPSTGHQAAGRRIAVIGAAGFIGRPLCERLAASGAAVIAVVRRPVAMPPGVEVRPAGTLSAATDWTELLAGADAAVYLASRAHAALPEAEAEEWIKAETASAARFARAACLAGIARLVLLSSIKVLGEATGATPFRADTPPAPADAYGRAKWAMEQAMRAVADGDGPGLAIIRPPLVYGPGVKGNFLALLRLAERGWPLPLAAIDNRRSLVFLDNLIDLIVACLTDPAASGATFLVRDDEEVSTPDLVRRLARHLDRPARLFRCPPAVLRLAARLAGRVEQADRLLGSLRVDDSATRRTLGWQPRVGLDQGLAETCRWYRAVAMDQADRMAAASR